MSRKPRFAVLLLAFMLVASTGVTYASAQTDGEYSVEAETTIDIPDRTVTIEGTNYTVTSIGKVTANETLEASTSGPDGAEFDVEIYTGNQELIGSKVGTDGSVSFPTENLRPGTYILAVYTADESTVSPQPVVVAGYETTLNAPSKLTTGESGNVSVQLDDVANLGSPENVELVITQNDEVVKTVQMNNESTYNYTAEVGSSLDSGEYRMYAMVHNETTVSGTNVFDDSNDVVGVTDAQTLTVSDGETQQADDQRDSSVYSSYNGSSDAGTPNEAAEETTTTIETTENETSEEPSTTTTETAETATDTQTEASSGTSTDSSMPNFALYIVALALVAAALVARR